MGSDHCPVWAQLDVPSPELPQGFLLPALSTSHTFAGVILQHVGIIATCLPAISCGLCWPQTQHTRTDRVQITAIQYCTTSYEIRATCHCHALVCTADKNGWFSCLVLASPAAKLALSPFAPPCLPCRALPALPCPVCHAFLWESVQALLFIPLT